MVAELDRHPELAVAEHVAEEHRSATQNECAEWSPARTQIRLSNRFQEQVGWIRSCRDRVHCPLRCRALHGRESCELRHRTSGDGLARETCQIRCATMN